MAESLKCLFQVAPEDGTLTDAYTVPASTQTLISTICVTNPSDVDDSFDLCHAIAGAADTDAQHFYSIQKLPARSTFMVTVGICMAATDVLRVQSTYGQLGFTAWGTEIT